MGNCASGGENDEERHYWDLKPLVRVPEALSNIVWGTFGENLPEDARLLGALIREINDLIGNCPDTLRAIADPVSRESMDEGNQILVGFWLAIIGELLVGKLGLSYYERLNTPTGAETARRILGFSYADDPVVNSGLQTAVKFRVALETTVVGVNGASLGEAVSAGAALALHGAPTQSIEL